MAPNSIHNCWTASDVSRHRLPHTPLAARSRTARNLPTPFRCGRWRWSKRQQLMPTFGTCNLGNVELLLVVVLVRGCVWLWWQQQTNPCRWVDTFAGTPCLFSLSSSLRLSATRPHLCCLEPIPASGVAFATPATPPTFRGVEKNRTATTVRVFEFVCKCEDQLLGVAVPLFVCVSTACFSH